MAVVIAKFKLPIPVDQLDAIVDTLEHCYSDGDGKDIRFTQEELHDGKWLFFTRETNHA